MRVLLAPSAFHPHRGGVEELTLKIAQHLQAAGHTVGVLANRHPPSLPAQSTVEGISVRRVAMPPLGRRPGSIVRFARSFSAVSSELDSLGWKPDVVHIICPSSQLQPVARWARRTHVPVVLTSQGETEMDANRLYQRSRRMRRVLRHEAAKAEALSACSRWTAERAARIAPAFEAAEIILNGVDPDDWHAGDPPREPVVCAWGRHVPQKGLDLLVAAFPLVRKEIPEAKLLLGGSGPDSDGLRASAGEGVELLGALDREGVRAALRAARVAVVPSRVEPFGIVAVEALAAGRNLVYSKHGGLGEASGGLGIGVDPENLVELAAAVVTALRAPVDVEAGRRRAEDLSWERLTARYVDLYARAISRR